MISEVPVLLCPFPHKVLVCFWTQKQAIEAELESSLEALCAASLCFVLDKRLRRIPECDVGFHLIATGSLHYTNPDCVLKQSSMLSYQDLYAQFGLFTAHRQPFLCSLLHNQC